MLFVKKWYDWIKLTLASAFGLGLAPVAPGSFGALLGVAMHLAVAQWIPEWRFCALTVCFLMVCVTHFLLTPWAQKYWHTSDPSHFVLDEVAGYLVVPLVVWEGPLWLIATASFFMFRIFDIIKLPIARYIDRNWHGAWGVLLDDIVSGLYASAVVWGLVLWHG